MSNNTTNVYWAPSFDTIDDINWAILYPDPISLYDELRPKMSNKDPSNNMFYCPSFKELASNILVFKNPMDANFHVNENNQIESRNKNSIFAELIHSPSIIDSILFLYGLKWIFLAEDDDIEIE